MKSISVPFIDLNKQNNSILKEVKDAFERIISNSSFVLGPEVDAFESEFAKFTNAKYAVAFNNGTSALHIGLKLLDIGPGDEVITTPFTFASSATTIAYLGAKPVFVDIDEETFNIDSAKIERAITKRTKAIMPIHLYGHPCDMDSLVEICDYYDLYLLEDAAQAHGAKYKSQHAGTFGNLGTFSFYPTKNLGACGEGGALVTDEKYLAERAKRLRNHGSKKRYFYDEIGYNYRMSGLQGAILRIKLKHLNKWNLQRQKAATYYNYLLQDAPLILPTEAPWAEHAYHLYTIRTPKREKLCKHLEKNKIGFSNHYPVPLHLQPCFKNLSLKKGSLPISEKISKEIVNLPLFPGITNKEIERVSSVVLDFFKK